MLFAWHPENSSVRPVLGRDDNDIVRNRGASDFSELHFARSGRELTKEGAKRAHVGVVAPEQNLRTPLVVVAVPIAEHARQPSPPRRFLAIGFDARELRDPVHSPLGPELVAR